MEANKKKMLIVGPGHGHNVEGKLSSLNDNTLFRVFYVGIDINQEFKSRYQNIKYYNVARLRLWGYRFPVLNSLLPLIMTLGVLLCNKIDIMYFLGLNGFQAAPILFFVPKHIITAYEVWSSSILDFAEKKKGLLSRFSRFVFKKINYVCQYWWNVKERFETIFPEYEGKFLMYQLSYSDVFFTEESHTASSDFVNNFLNSIPATQTVCFWPRSFIPSNNHSLLLDSLHLIKESQSDLLLNFHLYLWGGNTQNNEYRKGIEEQIADLSLSDYVTLVDHPFVPKEDIWAIEERSDFFVQITRDDILSQFIMEMIRTGKPFVLSNIRTFEYLNEKYGLEIPLVNNDKEVIAERIAMILSGEFKEDVDIVKRRKELCKRHFSRSNTKRWFESLYDMLYGDVC